jgi:TetR/AcrR family transcriptional regulator, ethionamide resistance regulator
MASPTTPARRRRRPRHDPQESEREILAAAEEILRELPLREVTVEAIMRRTGLQRPAFYTHFRDLGALVLRIVQDIGGELFAGSDPWLSGSGEPRAALCEALAASSAVYARHGPLMRALADAAPGDETVEQAYRGLVEQLATAVAERIEAGQRTGTIEQGLDARETARALVWMNERYLYDMVGVRGEQPAAVARTLAQVWLATLYGRP